MSITKADKKPSDDTKIKVVSKSEIDSYNSNQFRSFEKKFSKKMNAVIVLTMVVFGLNVFIILRSNQSLNKIINYDQQSLGISPNQLNNPNSSSKIQNNVVGIGNTRKDIDTFQNNPALVDLGFKVDIGKNYIANFDDSNCKTLMVPPSVNGCGFAVLLSGLGVPDKGVAFKSLNIEANFKGQDNRIQIDQKNYEKGTFTKTIGVLSSQSSNNKILLPSSIPGSDTLFFRFWIKSGTISISKISVDYYLIDDLKKVTLGFEDSQAIKSKTGHIYQDTDENSKYDSLIDQRWDCQSNFSGVMPVKAEGVADIILKRDDRCYIPTQPEKWQSDDKLNVLPPGKWLLVLDDETSYSFEIKNDAESFNIKLKN